MAIDLSKLGMGVRELTYQRWFDLVTKRRNVLANDACPITDYRL